MNRRTLAACALAAAASSCRRPPRSPGRPASTATVHPGVQTFTAGAQCTANFIYTDGADTYIGQAAHCSGTGAATDTDGCDSRVAAGRHAGRGHGRLAARNHGLQLVDHDAGARRDRSRHLRLQRPRADQARSGGRRGRRTRPCPASAARPAPPASAARARPSTRYGNSSLRGGVTKLSPKQGIVVQRRRGWSTDVYTLTPGHPRRLGLGLPDRDGQAAGVLSTVAARAARRLQRRRRPAARARLHARPRRPAGERRQRHAAVQRQPDRRDRRRIVLSRSPDPGDLVGMAAGPAIGSAAMSQRIVTLPGDGIGPEILAPTLELLAGLRPDLEFEEHLFGGASIDAHGTALTDEVLAACRGADAVLLAAVGGPKWDTTDPDKPRPEQGLLGLRKGLGLLRQPAPGARDRGADRREPAAPGDHPRHRPARRARADRRHLLRREDAHRRLPPATSAPTARAEIERIARIAFGCGALEGRLRRQGQRARDEPAVARGRAPRPLRGVPERRARAPARRQRRDDARRLAAPLRRAADREHVRRHPQRRGGDDHRLDRDAAERLARQTRTGPGCSSRSTARRPTSPARESPTRWRCSCPPR